MKIRAVIVDDEPPARKKIRHFLSEESRVQIVGEAGDGLEAVRILDEHRPDLLFLDIQMPRMNGFEVLQSVDERPRHIIFTTAYDQHALKAFEVRALDYLVKPFDAGRFREALSRVFSGGGTEAGIQSKIEDLLRNSVRQEKYLRRILLKESGRIFFVRCADLSWIEAEEKYVRLHAGKESYLHRETMNALEGRLDPDRFVRVHRGAIVNMQQIAELQAWSHGDYMIVLKSGARLPLGRLYRQRFLQVFQESS